MYNFSYILQGLAVTYDEGYYGAGSFGQETQSGANPGTTTTTKPGILSPLTGFVREQPSYLLFGIGIFIVVAIVLTIRLIATRKRR